MPRRSDRRFRLCTPVMKPQPRNAIRKGWGKFSIIILNMIEAQVALRRAVVQALALLIGLFVWGGLNLQSAAAAPQQQDAADRVPRSAAVTLTRVPITIDGVLDEPAWASAQKIGELVQRQPNAGDAPTERTD